MRLRIRHKTEYRYSGLVWLDPHILRLWPRDNAAQTLVAYELVINPPASEFTRGVDIFGNDFGQVAFDRLTDSLTFSVNFEVETHLTNPFDFEFPRGECEVIDTLYLDDEREELRQYLNRAEDHESVRSIALEIARESSNETREFLIMLARNLREKFEVVVRETGAPMPASESLRLLRGACRDLAVVYVEACRAVGIAARFVSGYHEGSEDLDRRYLHAWAEVFLPGTGWRGYDPSQGLAVSTSHVAVAAGPHSADAAPIIGAYRGDGIESELATTIDVEVSSNLG